MKDLFKKKGNQAAETPKPTKTKKSLFGKAAQDKPAKSGFSLGKKSNNSQTAKKPAFSFGKKPVADDDVFDKKPAKKGFSLKKTPTAKPAKTNQLDINKLITILVGLLLLALAALAVKVFLLDDETVNEPVPAIAAPPTPAQPAEPPVEETAEPADGEPVAANTEAGDEAAASENTTEAAVESPQSENEPSVAVATERPAAPKPSYEDFIRESNSRIYRERNTSGSETNTATQ